MVEAMAAAKANVEIADADVAQVLEAQTDVCAQPNVSLAEEKPLVLRREQRVRLAFLAARLISVVGAWAWRVASWEARRAASGEQLQKKVWRAPPKQVAKLS